MNYQWFIAISLEQAIQEQDCTGAFLQSISSGFSRAILHWNISSDYIFFQAFQEQDGAGIFLPSLGNLLLPCARSEHQESDYQRAARHVQVDDTIRKFFGHSSTQFNCKRYNSSFQRRKSILEHKVSRDPNQPRDFLDAYLEEMEKKENPNFDQEGLELTCLDLFKVFFQ